MSKKYYKYLPWLIIGAFSSYGVATHYSQTTSDLFIRIMSNSKKDKHP